MHCSHIIIYAVHIDIATGKFEFFALSAIPSHIWLKPVVDDGKYWRINQSLEIDDAARGRPITYLAFWCAFATLKQSALAVAYRRLKYYRESQF